MGSGVGSAVGSGVGSAVGGVVLTGILAGWFGVLQGDFWVQSAVIALALFAVRNAAQGRNTYYVIAGCAAVSMMMVQLGLNVFGSLDILPFTGVTFPFVSKGGSSLISCWGMLAYIKAGDTRSGGSFALRTSFENARRGKKKKEAVK